MNVYLQLTNIPITKNIDLAKLKRIRHWNVSFQVWMHVFWDTIASTFVSAMATHTTASVTRATS